MNIFRSTRVKIIIRLENLKRSTKVIRQLYPRGKICVKGGHVTSRDQGLSSNNQGRKRRESLGTRLRLEPTWIHCLLQLPVHTRDKNMFCRPIKIESFDNQTSKFTRPLGNVLAPVSQMIVADFSAVW